MREFLSVFKFTIYENVRKKSFIISTIITVVLVVALLNVPSLIKHFENNDKGKTVSGHKNIVFVVDNKGIFKGDTALLQQAIPGYEFRTQSPDKINDLKEQVKKGDGKSLMVLDEKSGAPYFDYWVREYGKGLNPDTISKAMKGVFTFQILKAAEVPDNTAKAALSDVPFKVKELGKGRMKGYISSILVMMILFFAIYYYGYYVAISVASEKTSRVMELLLTSTKPSIIIIGKSVAMGLLGLGQLLLTVLTAVITYKISFPKNFTISGQTLDFVNFTPLVFIMVIVYFILGYSLYAMMNAVAGAMVSKAEDVKSAIMPISLVSVISFYLAYGSVGFPDGSVARVASMIPFSAPFSMPARFLMTEVPAWQIATSLGILVITIIFIGWLCIKLYSSAVLHYGKVLKISELLKISKQQ